MIDAERKVIQKNKYNYWLKKNAKTQQYQQISALCFDPDTPIFSKTPLIQILVGMLFFFFSNVYTTCITTYLNYLRGLETLDTQGIEA